MLNKQLTPLYPAFSYDMRNDQVQVKLDFIQGAAPTCSIKIWGQILDEGGQPIPYALVYLYRYCDYSTTYELVDTTHTDMNGWYWFKVDNHRPPVCYTLVPCMEVPIDYDEIHENTYESTYENTYENTYDEEIFNVHPILHIAQNKPLCNE